MDTLNTPLSVQGGIISPELQQLLAWGLPKMHPEGRAQFSAMLESAIRGVVTKAFVERELAAFHVTRMLR